MLEGVMTAWLTVSWGHVLVRMLLCVHVRVGGKLQLWERQALLEVMMWYCRDALSGFFVLASSVLTSTRSLTAIAAHDEKFLFQTAAWSYSVHASSLPYHSREHCFVCILNRLLAANHLQHSHTCDNWYDRQTIFLCDSVQLIQSLLAATLKVDFSNVLIP